MRKIKIAIADDDHLFRMVVESFLNKLNVFEIIIQADNGNELIKALASKKPDIIILDLIMPVMDGYSTMQYLSEHHTDIKVLILTGQTDEQAYFDLIKKGANGFLPKSNDFYKIVSALYTIYEHDYYLAGRDLQKITTSSKSRTDIIKQYTKRQLEILSLICEGYTNKEISSKLFLSIRTIDWHKENMLQKAKVNNTVSLVRYAIKNELIEIKND